MKRNHTKVLSVTLTAALIGSLLAIPTAEAATKKLKVTAPKTVAVNSTIKIKTNVKCKFKSSNKKIATVNAKGVVKGKKAGKVKITVTAKKGKQKKTLKITVKKNAKEGSNKTPSTAVPGVSTTQPPQVDVTQSPKPPEEASQTPSVPGKSPNPATELPDIPKTPNPPTLTPDVPVPETPSVTSMPGPTDTETPDVPKTPGPSVTPEPTSTATPSPTNPSQTKQPIGITAEFEGKIPINWNLSGPLVAARMIGDTRIKIKLIYEDSEEEFVEWEELDWVEDGNGVVEENGTKYSYKKLKLQNLQTTLKVELVEVPDDVLYPVDISCSYEGTALSETKMPDVKDIKTEALMIDGSYREISSTEIRVVRAKRLKSDKKYECYIVYDYYFEYNGEKLHATAGDILYIPYE